MGLANLNSVPTLVQAPFVIVKIGDYTFGNVEKSGSSYYQKVTFPNFIDSLQVVKINGEVNQYTLSLVYQISKGDDPNLIDYALSSVRDKRLMYISYGDWMSPTTIFREEEALITKVTNNIDFTNAKITYNISATSTVLGITSNKFDWPARTAKASDVIKEIINNDSYGMKDCFRGFYNPSNLGRLIQGDDQAVSLEPIHCMDSWNYIKYCVQSMKEENTTAIPSTNVASKLPLGSDFFVVDNPTSGTNSYIDNTLGSSFYTLSVVDDNRNQYGGPYFKVSKVSQVDPVSIQEKELNTSIEEGSYKLVVGYPGDNFITSFQVNTDNEYQILYTSNSTEEMENYTFSITPDGNVNRKYTPSLMKNSKLHVSSDDESWWTQVVKFPINATIKFKGLVRPSILIDKVYLDVRFYGMKHIASGCYAILKQVDNISGNGYETTLDLQRIGDTL